MFLLRQGEPGMPYYIGKSEKIVNSNINIYGGCITKKCRIHLKATTGDQNTDFHT